MTIEELIKELQKYEPEEQVYSWDGGDIKFVGHTHEYIDGVIISDRLPEEKIFCPNCGGILFHSGEKRKRPYLCPDCSKYFSVYNADRIK